MYPACNKWVLVALEKRVSSATPRKKEVARQKVKLSNSDTAQLPDGDLIRKKWPMAKIVETFKFDNADVRSVRLKCCTCHSMWHDYNR